MIPIRHITTDDASEFLAHMKQLDQETPYMVFELDERQTTVEQMREMLQKTVEAATKTILVAVDGDKIVGHIAVLGGSYVHIRHKGHIVIGILDEYTGQKLGTRLFEAAESWARQVGLRRLELTVMAHNQRGIALYEKMGLSLRANISVP